MASKLLIVHGYSDGSTSFDALGKYLIEKKVYDRKDVYYVDYASMDDQATFRDFADKLDSDYQRLFPGNEQIDVICHSTGALVTRAWLVLHRERAELLKTDKNCPVDKLLMLAPANFGSDLAALGQSVLGRIRSTFFNSNSHGEDFLESGKQVLQGLEPASPFQWGLSELDLHKEKTWFRPSNNRKKRCLPFVFAAGSSYGGIQAELLRSRKKPGTDGTVRICGTSLNTRKCTLEFVPGEETVPDEFNRKEMEISRGQLTWHEEHKFAQIPFGVFADFNHGTIVDPGDLKTSKRKTIRDRYEKSLGQLIVEVLENHDMTKSDYEAMSERFRDVSEASYKRLRGSAKGKYQQFFFRVRDDVDLTVGDWYLDFSVWTPTQGADGKLSWKRHSRLSKAFDRKFESDFHTHSDDPSCRAMMLNCSELEEFVGELNKAKSALLMNVSAKSPVSNVRYRRGQYFMHDGSGLVKGSTGGGEYRFLFPNTTTLVDIILDRVQSDKILSISPS